MINQTKIELLFFSMIAMGLMTIVTILLAVYPDEYQQNLCRTLFFCEQANIRGPAIDNLIARAYFTVSQTSPDATAVDKMQYTKKIGVNSIVDALFNTVNPYTAKNASDISWYADDVPCDLHSVPVWNHMEVSGIAYGLSEKACKKYNSYMRTYIIKSQSILTIGNIGKTDRTAILLLSSTVNSTADRQSDSTDDIMLDVVVLIFVVGIVLTICGFQIARERARRQQLRLDQPVTSREPG